MAKVMLSEKELEQLYDAEWILSKNRIMEKISILFGDLAEEWRSNFKLKQSLIDSSSFRHPKISKGEQYQQLPWMILDYPREIARSDIFLVRCFFWWGKYFAIILHMEGSYQKKYSHQFQRQLHHKGWHLYIGADKWDNSFNTKNYTSTWTQTDIESRSFLKWIYLIPFNGLEIVEEEIKVAYQQLLDCLCSESME